MNTKFVSQGVPVILGEFSAMNRTGNPELTGANLDLHLASRLYYHQLIVDTANSLGIAPFYWDNGWTGLNGSGIFNRDNATVFDQDTVDALTGGAEPTGDYNGDGVVDAADYTVWRNTLGEDVANRGDGADGDADGIVDEDDYGYWRARYGDVARRRRRQRWDRHRAGAHRSDRRVDPRYGAARPPLAAS